MTPTPTPGAAEAERRQAMREKDARDYERWQSFLETTLHKPAPGGGERGTVSEMNDERLKQIRERADKATKGPWLHGWPCGSGRADEENGGYILFPSARGTAGYDTVVVGGRDDWQVSQGVVRPDDADFVASARTDIPDLLDYIASMRPVVAAAVKWRAGEITGVEFNAIIDAYRKAQETPRCD